MARGGVESAIAWMRNGVCCDGGWQERWLEAGIMGGTWEAVLKEK